MYRFPFPDRASEANGMIKHGMGVLDGLQYLPETSANAPSLQGSSLLDQLSLLCLDVLYVVLALRVVVKDISRAVPLAVNQHPLRDDPRSGPLLTPDILGLILHLCSWHWQRIINASKPNISYGAEKERIAVRNGEGWTYHTSSSSSKSSFRFRSTGILFELDELPSAFNELSKASLWRG